LRLTARDSNGSTDSETLRLDPQTVQLSFNSNPSGLELTVGGRTSRTPFTRTVIRGSANSISAPSPQSTGGQSFAFSSWSDGGARSHDIVAPDNPTTYVDLGSERGTTASAALPANTWTHLAASYGGGQLRIYVDGAQVAAQSLSGNIVASNGALRIGGNAVWPEWFGGLIDEVRIYNRALTQAEIQTDRNTPIGP
jgi:hypothetical protein